MSFWILRNLLLNEKGIIVSITLVLNYRLLSHLDIDWWRVVYCLKSFEVIEQQRYLDIFLAHLRRLVWLYFLLLLLIHLVIVRSQVVFMDLHLLLLRIFLGHFHILIWLQWSDCDHWALAYRFLAFDLPIIDKRVILVESIHHEHFKVESLAFIVGLFIVVKFFTVLQKLTERF